MTDNIEPGSSLPIDDPEAVISPVRQEAAARRFAVATWHPDAGRVDGETWWLAFREGAHWAIETSGRLSSPLQQAAQLIVLLAQRRCPHCGFRLDEQQHGLEYEREIERVSPYWRTGQAQLNSQLLGTEPKGVSRPSRGADGLQSQPLETQAAVGDDVPTREGVAGAGPATSRETP